MFKLVEQKIKVSLTSSSLTRSGNACCGDIFFRFFWPFPPPAVGGNIFSSANRMSTAAWSSEQSIILTHHIQDKTQSADQLMLTGILSQWVTSLSAKTLLFKLR